MPRLPMIICLILILFLLPVEGARTYIVGNDNLATHKSIGEAIAAASVGDIIYMKSGVYNEEVIMDKKITLKPLTGEKGTILLEGSGKKTGIKITADGCYIEGLTLKNFTDAGIMIESSQNTIKSNQLTNDNPGIIIKSAANNIIDGNSMKDCFVGVVLWAGATQNKITNNNIVGGSMSVFHRDVAGNIIADNVLSEGSIGINLMNTTSELVSRNKISGGIYGLRIYNSSDTDILDNIDSGSRGGMYVIGTTNAKISGNNIKDGEYGLLIENCTNCSLTDNIATVAKRAVYLMNTTRTKLNNQTVKGSNFGIALENSSDNVISKCKIYDTKEAIGLRASFRNAVADNSVYNTTNVTMNLEYSSGNSITGNLIRRGEEGIVMSESSMNKLENNKLNEIAQALLIVGTYRQSFDNAIDESNTADGKPIVYLYGQSGKLIQGRDLAHLTLAYCSNFTVEKNTIFNDALILTGSRSNRILENNVSKAYGILLLESSSNEISKNRAVGNKFSGLYLIDSDSNNINENKATGNNQNGISLRNSSANTIQGNTIEGNDQTGVWLNESKGNKIFENTISENPTGMLLASSSNNLVYHNNFLNNTQQAEDRDGTNSWDMGNATGGNYWSDHMAIGNPSRGWSKIILGSKMDNYPFQNENGWLPPGSAVRAAEASANQSQPVVLAEPLASMNQSAGNLTSPANKSASAILALPSNQTGKSGQTATGNSVAIGAKNQPESKKGVFKIKSV